MPDNAPNTPRFEWDEYTDPKTPPNTTPDDTSKWDGGNTGNGFPTKVEQH